jgi:gluconolactonase
VSTPRKTFSNGLALAEATGGAPGGLLVLSLAGRHLGTLATGEATANCAFGDDGRTLYVTDMHLCRVRLTTRGF